MLSKMARIEFESLEFEDNNDFVRVFFLESYYFDIKKDDLEKIGKFSIEKNAIVFDCSEKRANNKFNLILNESFNHLINEITEKKTIYIHRNSGIPLIGCLYFGIVDKGSQMIEIKPLTGCDINCIFCSVNEGLSSKKSYDFVVEKDYIIEELKKLMKIKEEPIDIFINPHGEPLLYKDLKGLIKDIRTIKNIRDISIITNCNQLTKEYADELINAGLTQINISVNSLDEKNARKYAGTKNYDISKIVQVIKYLNKKIKVILSPVFMGGLNEKDINGLIGFAKENSIEIMIQNFQKNKRGRNPAKEVHWNKFFDILKSLEEKHDIKLINKEFEIKKTKELDMPFKKNEQIKAVIKSYGRTENERIAVSKERSIVVMNSKEHIGKEIKIEITKANHNIFIGKKI